MIVFRVFRQKIKARKYCIGCSITYENSSCVVEQWSGVYVLCVKGVDVEERESGVVIR